MLKGISVTVYKKTVSSRDAINNPVYTTTSSTINNVLIAPASEVEALETTNLYGRKAIYTLALPKGTALDFAGSEIEFFGKRWRVIGDAVKGIDELVPTAWNAKIRVEAYDS